MADNSPATESEDTVGDIISLLGPDAALALIEQFGGARLYGPRYFQPEHRTSGSFYKAAALLGDKSARALVRRFGGRDLKVPSAKRWRIGIYRQRGASYGDIARAVGLSEVAVHHNLKLMGMTGRTRSEPGAAMDKTS